MLSRLLLALAALGTFLFGVNFLPLQTCLLGVILALAVPVIVCGPSG